MARWQDYVLRGTRAAQPTPASVAIGTIYCVTDESFKIERNDGVSWQQYSTAGGGDVSGPSSSVNSEIVLFSGITGKVIKRATGTGFVKATAGVYSTQTQVSLTTDVSGDLPFSSLAQASAASKLLGRGSAAGAGDFQEITPGTNLTMSGTTLNVGNGTIGMTLIAESLLGGDAATVTFSSIPGTYRHLKIVVYGRLSDAVSGQYIGLQFNGDTGANYDYQRMGMVNTTADNTALYAQTKMNIGILPAASSSSASQAGGAEVIIPHYAGSTFFKNCVAKGGEVVGTSGTNAEVLVTFGMWRSTAAITSVTVMEFGGGNFKSGSLFSLYGMA